MKFKRKDTEGLYTLPDYNKGSYGLEGFDTTVSLIIVTSNNVIEYYNGNITIGQSIVCFGDLQMYDLALNVK